MRTSIISLNNTTGQLLEITPERISILQTRPFSSASFKIVYISIPSINFNNVTYNHIKCTNLQQLKLAADPWALYNVKKKIDSARYPLQRFTRARRNQGGDDTCKKVNTTNGSKHDEKRVLKRDSTTLISHSGLSGKSILSGLNLLFNQIENKISNLQSIETLAKPRYGLGYITERMKPYCGRRKNNPIEQSLRRDRMGNDSSIARTSYSHMNREEHAKQEQTIEEDNNRFLNQLRLCRSQARATLSVEDKKTKRKEDCIIVVPDKHKRDRMNDTENVHRGRSQIHSVSECLNGNNSLFKHTIERARTSLLNMTVKQIHVFLHRYLPYSESLQITEMLLRHDLGHKVVGTKWKELVTESLIRKYLSVDSY